MLLAALAGCGKAPAITADRAAGGAVVVADASQDAPLDAAPDAGDAGADACVAGETWDAKVRWRKTWHAEIGTMLPGPLELVVPRMGARRPIYPDCAMAGGGCGDCSRPPSPDSVSCELTATHVTVDVGVDDVGPTYVEVVQRGDAIVANWTRGGFVGGVGTMVPETKSTDVLLKLPCAVHVRFVR